MLKAIDIKLLVRDIRLIDVSSTIDKIDGNSKVNRIKSWVKAAKSNTIIRRDSLIKFKLLVELSYRLDFFTLKASIVFIKLS